MKLLDKLGPCPNGLDFAGGFSDLRPAWQKCARADWMLWFAEKLGVDNRLFILAVGRCADTVRHLMKDSRSTMAVDAALAYGRGEGDLLPAISPALVAYAGSAIVASDESRSASSAYTAVACYAVRPDRSQRVHVAHAFRVMTAIERVTLAHAACAAAHAAYAVCVGAVYVADVVADAVAHSGGSRAESLAKTADICRDVLTDAVYAAITAEEISDGRAEA